MNCANSTTGQRRDAVPSLLPPQGSPAAPRPARPVADLELDRRTASAPLSSRSRLSAFDFRLPFLIDNDMHSRERSSYCKHSTYKILIDNEFHCADSGFQPSQSPKLLENPLSAAKPSTSQFLIDNSCVVISPVFGFQPALSGSNRPSPRLETPVSQRKQRIGPISNRPNFAFCNFCGYASTMPHWGADSKTCSRRVVSERRNKS